MTGKINRCNVNQIIRIKITVWYNYLSGIPVLHTALASV